MKFIIPSVFLALAIWFLAISSPAEIPIPTRVEFDRSEIEVVAQRTQFPDPPMIRQGGVEMSCADCHAIFDSSGEGNTNQRGQHQHIELDHGMNAQCYNCHSDQNRNKLILKGGEEVGYGQVHQLCGSCHGPTYRDWEKGIHGRTNGYWDSSKGERKRLTCTQCHDPHSPAFGKLTPLPGPNTLRMRGGGPPDPNYKHSSKHNPLILKSLSSPEAGASHE
ncbi:MAG: hypothetical protein P1V35_02185 [Planctomycetota bacterium]|nr:hypothetical protein [Planctomycetota bacterium]